MDMECVWRMVHRKEIHQLSKEQTAHTRDEEILPVPVTNRLILKLSTFLELSTDPARFPFSSPIESSLAESVDVLPALGWVTRLSIEPRFSWERTCRVFSLSNSSSGTVAGLVVLHGIG